MEFRGPDVRLTSRSRTATEELGIVIHHIPVLSATNYHTLLRGNITKKKESCYYVNCCSFSGSKVKTLPTETPASRQLKL